MLHDIGLLGADVVLDRLTTLCFFIGASFVIFMWMLHGVLLDYSLSTLHSSEECPGPCNKHVFFTGSIIARRDCNVCPVLDRAAIIGVGG